MADLMTSVFYVTDTPVNEGQHFLHRDQCQVLPRDGLEQLGEHTECALAMEEARAKFDPVNGCASCCPDCYTGSAAFEAGEGL